VNLSVGIGDKGERPLQASQLERSYEFGIGHFTVDLTDVALPPGTTEIDVALGIGDLLVRVPDDAALEIRAHADGGQVTVLGRTDEGTRPDEHAVVRGSTSAAPTLELDVEVGFGHLAVRRG
jgi:predicted membrane protein